MSCTFIPITNDGDVEMTEPFTISFSMFGGLPPDTPTPPQTAAVVTIIDDGALQKKLMLRKYIFLLMTVSLDFFKQKYIQNIHILFL